MPPGVLPYDAMHVWEIFDELMRTRESGGFSINPVTHREIAAWMEVYRVRLDRWEVEAILLLDVVFRGIIMSTQPPSPPPT